MNDKPCTKCKTNPRAKSQRWCKACRAEWMRNHRKPLKGEARERANARSYANVYLRRGKLERQPCEACGAPSEEMHHDDYSKPLEVRWFCRSCHVEHHYPDSQ